MLFSSLFHERQRVSRGCQRRPPRARLLLECLESRNLLSAPAITNVNTDTEGGPGSDPHNETTIAVNPTNPLNMIGSANDYQAVFDSSGQLVSVTQFPHAHVTFDGGQTWTEYAIPVNPKQYPKSSDPAVAFDAQGTAYLSMLGFKALPHSTSGGQTSPDLLVAHSADGGKSWSIPELVAAGTGTGSSAGIFIDKPYIAAWGHGNAIVTLTEFNDGPGGITINAPIVASVTHDGGNTWTDPVQISGPFVNDQGSVPVVAADGSIDVAFLSFDNEVAPEFRDHYEVVKVDPSTGQALGAPAEVGLVFDGVHDLPINVNGSQTYQDSEFRTNPLGNITADPTNASHLAVIYSDMRNNPGGLLTSTDPYQVKTNSDIIVSQSFDGGKSWSAATALAIPNDQFMPWGAYNVSGRLQIGYFDRSYDPANHKYGYSLASEKSAGSLNFTFQQLTTQLSDPTQGDAFFSTTVNSNFPKATTFLGDYSGIAVTPTGVVALWTDMRLPATTPPPFTGWGEDAFFADPPGAGSAAAALVPTASSVLAPRTARTAGANLPTPNQAPRVLTAFFAALAKQEQAHARMEAKLASPSTHEKDAPVAAASSQVAPPSKANAMAYFERLGRVRKVADSSDLFSPLA